MKILITGGAGFIGSHLAEHFSKAGHTITILDNLSTGSESNLKMIDFTGELIVGDIRDVSLVEKLVKDSDLILHMAAALGVKNIMESTIESISTNIVGSEVVLLEAARNSKRIIIASTSEIYGKNPKQPLNELDDRVIGSPQNFRWSYSDSKAIEESIARVLYLEKSLPVTTIRFFNTIGPRQTGKYGMVVPRFIEFALKNLDIPVHGSGEQTRVFCNVTDAVLGVESVLNLDKTLGEVFNVGGFGEISINELASRIIKVTNSKSKIQKIPYSEAYPDGYEDMQRRVPDTSKISRVTGWKASKSLDDSLREIVESLSN